MKSLKKTLLPAIMMLLVGILAVAQSNKQFTKDGLTFDYSSAWVLQDQSNPDAQQITLAKADSDAQIRVFAFRTQVNTPEKTAEAKKVLVDPYLNSTAKQFEQMGAKPERLPANTEIGGAASEGVKVQAVLDGETGAAEIYWAVIGQRLVVLTFFGPDKARKQASEAWDTIRTSLKVEDPAAAKPAVSPKSSTTPKP